MSDRDKGLRAADDEIPLATRAICLEHLSRNLQKNCGVAARNIFNSAIHFALTEEKLQAGMDKLQEVSPQAVDYLRGIDLALWATPHFPGKWYGHNTSNVVEIMNSWIIEERKLSIIDLLHALWCKNMDLRFRHLQEAQKYNPAEVLTKYSAKLLEQSMQFSHHQQIRFADPNRASVQSYLGKWCSKPCFLTHWQSAKS